LTPGPYDSSVGYRQQARGLLAYMTRAFLSPFVTGGRSVRCSRSSDLRKGSLRPWLAGSQNLVAAQHASSDVVGHVAVELPDPRVVGDHVGHYHTRG
jgi:hypothetical protein